MTTRPKLLVIAPVPSRVWPRTGCGTPAIVAIIGAGALLRLPGLSARSFWFDEAFSWRLSSFPLPELLARAARDNNPPLYYVFLKCWAAVWGESAVALRGLSVAFGLVTIVGVWLFAREAFTGRDADTMVGETAPSRRLYPVGLLSAALLAASAFHIKWAGEARMYALGTALAALSSWALLRALRRDGLRSWMVYAALALAFAYAHTYALFTLALQTAFTAGLLTVRTWKQWRGQQPGNSCEARGILRRLLRHPLLAAALIVAGYSLWLPILLRQRAQVQALFWAPTISWYSVSHDFYALWCEPIDAGNSPQEATVATVLTAGLMLSLLWRPRAGEWLTFCLAAGPVTIALAVSVSDTRLFAAHYLIFAHTFMLVALARLVCRATRPLERGLVIAIVLGSMVWIAADWRMKQDIPHKPGGRAASALIDAARLPDEPVVVCSPLLYFSVLFHSTERDGWRLFDDGIQPRIHYYGAAVIRQEELIDEERLAATTARRVWAVNMQGGGWGTHAVRVPRGWKAVSSRRFPEVYGMQGEIVVVEYLTRDNGGGTIP